MSSLPMPHYFLLTSERAATPGLELTYDGRYRQGAAIADLLGTTIEAARVDDLIKEVGRRLVEPDFVFDRFLSVFRTEFNARFYLATALNASTRPVRIIERMEAGWQQRLARMTRLMDLDVREEQRGSSLVHYTIRDKPAANGFGPVRVEQQANILANACGVRDSHLLSSDGICDLIEQHMRAEKPFSYVRFNHCEPRVAGLHYVFNLSDANDTAQLQWGRGNLTLDEMAPVASSLLTAARNADLLGIPSIATSLKNKLSLLENSCYVLFRDLGLLQPRHRFTHVNTHLRLGTLDRFYRLLQSPRRLSLISGRDVVSGLGERVGRSDIDWIPIPVEHVQAKGDPTGQHFPDAFHAICDRLRATVRPGHVFLVRGGILGKIYCDLVKVHGGIALDLGSLFDAWAGKVTRGAGFQTGLQL